MNWLNTLLFAALALAAANCSSSATVAPDSGGDTDADTDTDTDTDVDIWDWTCSLPLDTPCDEGGDMPTEYNLQIDPADVGLTFVHGSFSPHLLLAEREIEGGTEPVALMWRQDMTDIVLVEVIDPPAGALTAIDIGSPRRLEYSTSSGFFPNDEGFGYIAAALICGAASCSLYKVALDENLEPLGLDAIPDGEVPIEEPRAMAWAQTCAGDDGFNHGRICVAGDGVACFDGETWGETWNPGDGMLNAIDVEIYPGGCPGGVWVAGQNGIVATDRDGAWVEIDSGTSMDLTAISAHDGIWAAGGASGFVFGDGEHAIPCEFGAAYTATFVHEWYASAETLLSLTALAADHAVEIVGTSAGLSACVQPNDFAGAPQDAEYWHTQDGEDTVFGYALTPEGFYRRTEFSTGTD